MDNNATLRFFVALGEVSARIAGPDSAVARAAATAAESPSPTHFAQAQEQLVLLDDDLRDQILEALHAHMRSDLSAIWDNLPNAKPSGRAN